MQSHDAVVGRKGEGGGREGGERVEIELGFVLLAFVLSALSLRSGFLEHQHNLKKPKTPKTFNRKKKKKSLQRRSKRVQNKGRRGDKFWVKKAAKMIPCTKKGKTKAKVSKKARHQRHSEVWRKLRVSSCRERTVFFFFAASFASLGHFLFLASWRQPANRRSHVEEADLAGDLQ